jgi:hypothetical protein
MEATAMLQAAVCKTEDSFTLKNSREIIHHNRFAGISTGAWLGLTALELMQAVEREKRHAAFLKQQLDTQRQLGKNEAEIEALQRQIKEQNDKLNAMQATMEQKKVEA